MLCGLLGATPRSRDFIVAYPVTFSLRYLYIRPISRTCVVCSFVRLSQGDAARRHESSRVLFVSLNKSETYKETIVRVLVPQSLTEYSTSTVQYSRLCFEMAWWTTPRYSVTFAGAILRIDYCNVRTSARFHEVVSVCVTATRTSTSSRYTLPYSLRE